MARLEELPYFNQSTTYHQRLLQDTEVELRNLSYPTDPHVLKNWLLDWFANKCFKHGKDKPLSTKSLIDKRACTLRVLGPRLALHHRDYLINQVNRFCREYTYENDVKVTHAPAIKWEKMNRLAIQLWCDQSTGRGVRPISFLQRKRAATLVYITNMSGCRWGSACLLRWEDLQFFKEESGALWLHIRLRVSKTNIRAEVHQQITFKTLPRHRQWQCPVRAIARYWLYMRCPTRGLMFHDRRKRIDGHAEIRLVRNQARKNGWEKLPAKNTGRVTIASTLVALGATDTQIDLFLHWRSNMMRKHYANQHVAREKSAGAAILFNATLTNLNRIQESLQ